MSAHENAPASQPESENQQDEEAQDRFADESPAAAPGFEAVGRDLDDGPEQPDDEA